jgi:copper chaperone NosL
MMFVCLSGVLFAVSVFFPWWGMKFIAPQYPEGLDIIVYPYKMAGRIDIINGLNHYIGMKPFSEESFPELTYLPYIIGAVALLTIIVGLLRNWKLLYGLIGLIAVGGIIGIYDIHRWLKAFGTELDPKAPIDIAPFVPPILGKNTIANFVTHSYFTYGSFIIGVAFLLLLYPIWKERRQR